MAGYRREKKILKLTFADGEFEGLEVRVKALSVDGLMTLTKLNEPLKDTVKSMEMLEELFRFLADRLLSWNLEDDEAEEGVFVPVPATMEGVKRQDLEIIMAVVEAWMDVVARIDAPLDAGSSSGETSPVLSLPMEAPLMSLLN